MRIKRPGKVRFETYFSEEDWEIIKNKKELSKEKTLSAYVRKVAISGEIVVYDFKAASELIYEINKIGVNVNQIARKVNELETIHKSDIYKLRQEYEDLCHMLNQFLLELPPTKA